MPSATGTKRKCAVCYRECIELVASNLVVLQCNWKDSVSSLIFRDLEKSQQDCWDSQRGGVLALCSLLIFVHSPCSLIFSHAPCIFSLLLPCNFSFSLLPWKWSIWSLILWRTKIRQQFCTLLPSNFFSFSLLPDYPLGSLIAVSPFITITAIAKILHVRNMERDCQMKSQEYLHNLYKLDFSLIWPCNYCTEHCRCFGETVHMTVTGMSKWLIQHTFPH